MPFSAAVWYVPILAFGATRMVVIFPCEGCLEGAVAAAAGMFPCDFYLSLARLLEITSLRFLFDLIFSLSIILNLSIKKNYRL